MPSFTPNTDRRITAYFKSEDLGPVQLPVLAWNELGEAMVPDRRGHLRVAAISSDFMHISTAEFAETAYEHIVPNTTGHVIVYADGDETFRSTPIAWGFQIDGTAVPLDIDATGFVDAMSDNGKVFDPLDIPRLDADEQAIS